MIKDHNKKALYILVRNLKQLLLLKSMSLIIEILDGSCMYIHLQRVEMIGNHLFTI